MADTESTTSVSLESSLVHVYAGKEGYNYTIDLNAIKESVDKIEFDDDYDLEDEAIRLMKEIQNAMKVIKESKFYAKLTKQLKNDTTIKQNLRRVLGSNKHVLMVIYALGSIEFNFRSQYQLATALLLKRDFSDWIGDIEVFDPDLSLADIMVLKQLGCNVLSVDESFCRQVDRPTLFFMPYPLNICVKFLLATNWCPSQINQMILLTSSSFKDIIQNLRNTKDQINTLQYFKAIKKFTSQININANFGLVLHEFAWHFFNVESHYDMETLWPDNPSPPMKYVPVDHVQAQFDLVELMKDSERKFNLIERTSLSSYYGSYRGPYKFRRVWRPPPTGWIKLNFSGKGYDNNSHAGFGGIFHNENGETLATYSGSFGKVNAMVANVESLRQGLRCLQSMLPPVDKLIIEGDDLRVVRWANDCPEPPNKIKEGINDILDFRESIKCLIYNIYEEANSMAIELAKEGAKLDRPHIWISRP